MPTLKTTPSSKRITFVLDPFSTSMASTVCVSMPHSIFAWIFGNPSRRLQEYSVSGKSLKMTLQRRPVARAPRLYSELPTSQRHLRRLTIPVPKTSPPWKQLRRLIGAYSKMLDYWETSWRIRMSRVRPTCQLIPKVFRSCNSFFPLSLLL